MTMSRFTDKIDAMLKMKGIKKYEFYEDIGILSATFSKWKNNHLKPSAESIRRIAEYLEVEESYLLEDQVSESKEVVACSEAPQPINVLSASQMQLWEIIQKLDRDSVGFLLNRARSLQEFQRFKNGE